MPAVTGLHHVTVIADDPAENLAFYTGTLGMRLVKRTVNQDAPGTYHLFYADAAGTPGTDLTFFPWPGTAPGRAGIGLTIEVALAVPAGELSYWRDRLTAAGVQTVDETRFGETALVFRDPHGLPVALVETGSRDFEAWSKSPVPTTSQIRGLHAVRLWERDAAATSRFLQDGMGLVPVATEGAWHRLRAGDGSGTLIDLRELPDMARGTWGAGSVHHVAWRVPTPEAQLALRARVAQAGARPTEVIDRFWFKSIYFKEPGGALFEIATDGPGFSVDESPDTLGEALILPPWLEDGRAGIEAALPPLP